MKAATIGALVLLFLAIPSSSVEKKSFRELQWKFPRVRTAAKEKNEVLEKWFKEKGVAFPPRAVLLRAFKKEALLELWAADGENKPYVLVHEYRICTSSGALGPKRRFGDEQVPEGFYVLDWFNPQSNFYLSLHINYPNGSDRILGSHQNPGGDIFLHGNCASIGCIPITDDGIKEVYWLAALVHNEGQRHLPIHIFPGRLTDDGFNGLEVTHGLTPDSGQIAAQAFQALGDVDLADPDPDEIDIFLFYNHPAIPDRVQFSLTYDPWSRNEQPEFVK